MRKRLVVALIAILCVIGVTGFSPKAVMASVDTSNTTIEGNVDDQETLQNYMESYLDGWNNEDISEFAETNKDSLDDEQYQLYLGWGELQAELGEGQSIASENFQTEEDGSIIGTMIVTYENGDAQFTFTFDESQNITDIQVEKYVDEEANKTIAEKMGKAGINTVMSICIVFAVLIFIACIISLFKFIPMLFSNNKKEETPVTAPEVVVAPVVEDVTDDTEIVAVITAAIVASMGSEAPADGLHITSIKRRVNSKWKKGGY